MPKKPASRAPLAFDADFRAVLRKGYGDVVVNGYDPTNTAAGNRILFDYGSYSDILFLGEVTDGMSNLSPRDMYD